MYGSKLTKKDILIMVLVFSAAFFVLWVFSKLPDYKSMYGSLSDDYRMLQEEYQHLKEESKEQISDSYTDGFEDGKDEGSSSSYETGYDDGYMYGYSDGYDVGYKEGTQDDDARFQIMDDWPIWLWEDELFQYSLCEALHCFWEGREPEDSSGSASSFYSMIVDYYNDWR